MFLRCKTKHNMSQCMRFPTIWYVRPAKPQISLRIRAVWSEPLLVAWVFYDCYATDWTPFGVPKLKRRLHRLVWVYTCQNVKLWKSHALAHMQIQLHQHPSKIINGHNKPLTIHVLLYLGADFYVDIKPYTIPPLLFEWTNTFIYGVVNIVYLSRDWF